MKTLKQFIEGPRRPLASVSPGQTVFEALQVMAQADVGALLVLEGDRLAGVFSERDYARKIVLHGLESKHTPVRDVMTAKVVCVTAERTLEECMAIMTDKHIRHLPILDADQKVLGVVSIGDVVKEMISQQRFIIGQLESYIAG